MRPWYRIVSYRIEKKPSYCIDIVSSRKKAYRYWMVTMVHMILVCFLLNNYQWLNTPLPGIRTRPWMSLRRTLFTSTMTMWRSGSMSSPRRGAGLSRLEYLIECFLTGHPYTVLKWKLPYSNQGYCSKAFFIYIERLAHWPPFHFGTEQGVEAAVKTSYRWSS